MSENQEIPKSWAWAKLGEVCKLKNGYAFKSSAYSKDGIPIIRISDINDGIVSPDDAVKVSLDEEYENYVIKKDEILVAMSGATTGKFGIYKSKEKAYQNQRVGKFQILEKRLLNNTFLLFLLYSLKRKILEDSCGGAQPNISSGKIEELEIPLPPIPEQNRIVAKIEELFSSLDKGIESLKTAQQQLKVYRQAVLKWAFEGKLTNTNVKEGELPEGWQFKKICELGRIETGTTPSKKNPKFYSDKYPFYKPTDLNAGNNVGSSTDGLSELGIKEARFVPAASTLVTCIGATIGKTGFIKKGGGFNQQINAIIPLKEVYPKFIFYQAVGPDFQKQIQNNASATTLPILNKGKFENLLMVHCLPKEQQAIVAEIETRLSVCDKIEESIEQSLKQSESLQQSILKKAFEGKLVPQNPSDLPAPRPGKWFVYVLECDDGSYYKGYTKDILERWKQHARGVGAEWTAKHPPRKLVHWEEFSSEHAAVEREKDLKTGFGRKWLQREIKAGRSRQAGEPAIVLLARIKAEKESLKKKK